MPEEQKAKYISLAQAAKNTPYSQEYLSLLARRGKIPSKKIGRNWYTTSEAVVEYIALQQQLLLREVARKKGIEETIEETRGIVSEVIGAQGGAIIQEPLAYAMRSVSRSARTWIRDLALLPALFALSFSLGVIGTNLVSSLPYDAPLSATLHHSIKKSGNDLILAASVAEEQVRLLDPVISRTTRIARDIRDTTTRFTSNFFSRARTL